MNSALIVVDMLNTYAHEDADRLTKSVRDALPGIKALIERAQRGRADRLRQRQLRRLQRVPARARTARARRART